MTRRRWPWRLAFMAGVAVLAALLVTGPYRLVFGAVAGSTAARRPAPCLPGRAVDVLDSPHVSPAQAASVRYDSLPPTSGPHYAFTVATGVYTSPVADGLTVHALEHGHVAIQYAPATPQDEVAALTRIARRYGADVVLAPYPELRHGIALTAWGASNCWTTTTRPTSPPSWSGCGAATSTGGPGPATAPPPRPPPRYAG